MTSGIFQPPELIRRLAGAAREFPLREKLLVAPSYRVGAEWMDGAARAAAPEGGVVNMRLVTPKRLLLDFAEDEMRRRSLRPPGAEETLALVGRLFAAARAPGRTARGEGEAGYFTRLPPSFSLIETLAGSLDALDGAGLRGLGRTAGHFASREKFDELSLLFRNYRARRARAGCASGAELLDCALAGLRARGEGGELPLLLLPESVGENADPQSLALFAAWPEASLRALGEDAGEPSAAFSRRVADSTANEARQALRTIFREGAPLDSVEIVVTDARTYIPALCEAGMEAFGCAAENAPFTFHAGIPALYSRPARLLAAWLRWVEGDLPPAGLAGMLRDRLLGEGWRETAPSTTPEDLAARVLQLPVHGAVEEYVRALGRDQAGGAEAWLARHFGELLPLAADGRTLAPESAPAVLGAAGRVLRLADHRSSEFDAYAASALASALDAWLPHCDWAGFKPLAWLENLVATLRVMGLGPRPGAAHVADIASGGFAGRPRTLILGLDEGRFPGGSRQDPVLLDRERMRLSRALPLSPRARERREAAMRRLLARLRGSVTLSYARHGGEEGEQYPAQAYSRFAGEESTGGSSPVLRPAVLRPNEAGEVVCGRDALLWAALAPGRGALAPGDFARWHPRLARGREAREARLRGDLNIYNGLVPEAGEDYRGAPWAISPTDLETLAVNPAEYFYKRVLALAPPERFASAPGKWLEGNERGDLVHRLFQDFVQELIDNGDAVTGASLERHRDRLLEMLEQSLRIQRRRKPVRDALAHDRERGEMIEACAIFLNAELARSAEGRPIRLEAALGGAKEDAPPWARVEPVELALPSGGSILLKGRIDRIDRLHDHGGLVLLDYKTGRADGFSRADPFQGGRHLQPLLYCMMLESALRGAGREEPVRRFSYFFPMPRDEGGVIGYGREQLGPEGMEIVASLRDLLAGGRYPVAASSKEYAYSDYLPLFS